MSQFYDQASLVMVPSGYKSGKIYSQKPLSTSGELSFSRASTATRVNASGLIESVASGVPRLDYSGGASCPSLLLEGQRTNSATYSEQIDNASWSKLNVTVSANQATAPDGTTSADLIYPTTTGTDRLIEQVIAATIGQTWTSSFFVKASGFDWVLVYSPNLGTCWFNASTGVFGTIAGNVTATVLGQVNGYWRISFTGTVASSNAYFYAGPADANGTSTATANGTNGILLWGCQLEQGSYATSYIPTLSSAVTRVKDNLSKTSVSSLIGQTEGTMYAEIEVTYGQQILIITHPSGNEGNRLQVFIDGDLKIGAYRGDGSVNILSSSAYTLGSTAKIALRYKENDYALYVNGTLVGTDTSGTVPISPSAIYIGEYVDGGKAFSTILKQAILFPTAYPNATLATLTA